MVIEYQRMTHREEGWLTKNKRGKQSMAHEEEGWLTKNKSEEQKQKRVTYK